MFCVVVHAVSVPDAVCVELWKAFAPDKSDDVIVRPTPLPADIDVPHESPPEAAAHVVLPEPSVCRKCVFVPAVVGSFIVHVPAASAVESVTTHDVVQVNLTAPVVHDAAPVVNVPIRVVFQFFNIVSASLLVHAAVPLPTTRSLSVDT